MWSIVAPGLNSGWSLSKNIRVESIRIFKRTCRPLKAIHTLEVSRWIYCVVIPYQLLYYRRNFQNCLRYGWFDFRPGFYFFHSANQPTIQKKLQEKSSGETKFIKTMMWTFLGIKKFHHSGSKISLNLECNKEELSDAPLISGLETNKSCFARCFSLISRKLVKGSELSRFDSYFHYWSLIWV